MLLLALSKTGYVSAGCGGVGCYGGVAVGVAVVVVAAAVGGGVSDGWAVAGAADVVGGSVGALAGGFLGLRNVGNIVENYLRTSKVK